MPANTPVQAGETKLFFDSPSQHQSDASTQSIFSADFENTRFGIYTKEQLNLNWNNPSWSDGIEENVYQSLQPIMVHEHSPSCFQPTLMAQEKMGPYGV